LMRNYIFNNYDWPSQASLARPISNCFYMSHPIHLWTSFEVFRHLHGWRGFLPLFTSSGSGGVFGSSIWKPALLDLENVHHSGPPAPVWRVSVKPHFRFWLCHIKNKVIPPTRWWVNHSQLRFYFTGCQSYGNEYTTASSVILFYWMPPIRWWVYHSQLCDVILLDATHKVMSLPQQGLRCYFTGFHPCGDEFTTVRSVMSFNWIPPTWRWVYPSGFCDVIFPGSTRNKVKSIPHEFSDD
jgi:hypothetical protein